MLSTMKWSEPKWYVLLQENWFEKPVFSGFKNLKTPKSPILGFYLLYNT